MNRREFLMVTVSTALCVTGCLSSGPGAKDFTIVTYNLRHGVCNEDPWRIDLARQMDLVCAERPRFVAVQEVEVGSKRTGGVDQPAQCAKLLGEGYVATFGKAIDYEGGGYGVALLSAEKPVSVERLRIPDSSEDRLLLVCEFTDCFVASTHFSVATEKDRETALAVVRKRLAKGVDKPFFLCGDLNAKPDSMIIRELQKDFVVLSPMNEATFIGGWGKKKNVVTDASRCIDYVLCDKRHAAQLAGSGRVLGPAAAVAPSDHRPIAVKVSFVR